MISTHWIKVFAVMLVVFFMLDLLWLGVVAKSFYRAQLSQYMTTNFNWYAAVMFYLIFLGGMIYFVVAPTLLSTPIFHILIKGAIFGLVTYATYDLTNLATVKSWPWFLSLVDIVWGVILSAVVSVIGFLIHRAG